MQHGTCISKTQSPSTKEERDHMNKIPYASSIGSIMYAMLCTRPDVSYALSATSMYQSDPGDAHWVAFKNILKYLRKTKDSFLVYGGQKELSVIGYIDVSFLTDKNDFRSQYGYVFYLNGGDVSCKIQSKIQFLILQTKPSTLLPQMQQRKLFGSRSSLANLA
ncbi:secreted RxLR effector protein 161-like [Vicia villosa]|uniref:secreted RxLR effector protein 161-like n=1 Tax=Vicia villosa TaxID=3911 RepID=UPI00273B8B8F|nr:secreted RxLR effector protein 161-like [Vicia villosa]